MSTPNSQGRILVVDDQAANLRVVGTLLTREGYEVTTARNGDEALALCGDARFDLILLDVMMPSMDGFEVLNALHRGPDNARIPVIFVTAAHDRDLLLRAFDAGVVDYVTKPFLPEELLARVNAHIGLKLTVDRLERVAREREELVNLVAHDLKNPLTSALFASELLLEKHCKPERVPRYLEIIHESATDALGYIHQYLESRHQTKQADRRERASVTATLNWLLQRYEVQLEATGIEARLLLPPRDALMAIDELVLRQVAENLVTNAIKYAPGAPLTLSARMGAPGYWQIVVADRGPGIPDPQQRDLFKPFTRLTDTEDGMSSGLGLSLARQIIAEAGGQLWYEPRRHGGSRFIIELPEADNSVEAASPDPEDTAAVDSE